MCGSDLFRTKGDVDETIPCDEREGERRLYMVEGFVYLLDGEFCSRSSESRVKVSLV